MILGLWLQKTDTKCPLRGRTLNQDYKYLFPISLNLSQMKYA